MDHFSTIFDTGIFANHGFKKILITGIGYGRNAIPFMEKGMLVTGIEVSETAIQLAKKNFGDILTIYHGTVVDMPFDHILYDGIFCHGLIYLLDEIEINALIAHCYQQLEVNGLMVFTVITKKASTYQQGELIETDRYKQFGGVNIFFYDLNSIRQEFGQYGLFNIEEIEENYPFYQIFCKK